MHWLDVRFRWQRKVKSKRRWEGKTNQPFENFVCVFVLLLSLSQGRHLQWEWSVCFSIYVSLRLRLLVACAPDLSLSSFTFLSKPSPLSRRGEEATFIRVGRHQQSWQRSLNEKWYMNTSIKLYISRSSRCSLFKYFHALLLPAFCPRAVFFIPKYVRALFLCSEMFVFHVCRAFQSSAPQLVYK